MDTLDEELREMDKQREEDDAKVRIASLKRARLCSCLTGMLWGRWHAVGAASLACCGGAARRRVLSAAACASPTIHTADNVGAKGMLLSGRN